MARKSTLNRSSRNWGRTSSRFFLILLILFVLSLGTLAFRIFETEDPTVQLQPDLLYLNQHQELDILASDGKSGLRSLDLAVVQGEKRAAILHKAFPRTSWLGAAGPATAKEKATIDLKKTGLNDGQAVLEIIARDFSLNGLLQGNATILRREVIVDSKPPRITIEHHQATIQAGGSGIVTYTVAEPVSRHGVQIDDRFFPGYTLSGGKDIHVAYIALPWNAEKPKSSQVVAVDQAGNQGHAAFTMHFKKMMEKRDRISISDAFLNAKVPEFEAHYPQMSGSPLDKYLFANNTIRKDNDMAIQKACARISPEQLWKESFLRMPGAGRAGFADQRTYLYQDREVDQQVHLGVDIASTTQAEVRAANSGRVIFTGYLGIYGNTIILDHGQGVASLYSHLSSAGVTMDQLVKKNEPLGRTGNTGMAWGDHLHFSMLVHGLFVNPKEWWDQHWIAVNINAFTSP